MKKNEGLELLIGIADKKCSANGCAKITGMKVSYNKDIRSLSSWSQFKPLCSHHLREFLLEHDDAEHQRIKVA